MKRVGASLAASAALMALSVPMAPSAQAATYTMYTTHIELNGSRLYAPPAFTDKTTFMPIFFVDDVLSQLGVNHSWTGSVRPKQWKLTTPGSQSINLSLNAQTGNMNLYANGKLVESHIPSLTATPPYGGPATTFVPIWYIQEFLRALGITNDWNGQPGVKTWSLHTYTAYSKAGKLLGNFLTESTAENALTDYSGGVVRDPSGTVVYTQPAFANVDLRFPAPPQVTASAIDSYLLQNGSPLAGLGATIMQAQTDYGVDANYLLSHAIEETGWGKSAIALTKNNLYGYGATDQSNGNAAGLFPSEQYAVLFQAFEVRTNYLTPGASNYGGAPTLNGMHQNYASDPNWATNIDDLMDQFALATNTTVKDYPQYSPSTPAPAPQQNTEPAYWLNGAQASAVAAYPTYAGAPVFSDSANGATELFTRTLQQGDSGADVEGLQSALNQAVQANLPITGFFGPLTEAAVKQFQLQNNLPQTGIVDQNLWNLLQIPGPTQILPAGAPMQVDEIKEGMVGGTVSEWLHIVGVGWTPAAAVQWTNVYRLTVSDPTSPADVMIPVVNPGDPSVKLTDLRAGDTVVALSSQPSNGYYTIQYVDQNSQTLETGLISAAAAGLQAQ